MPIKPFKDFELHSAVDKSIIDKYTNVLPNALITIWKEYGFGCFAKGFLRTINPDEYQELLKETYANEPSPIPILTTALGDIITWNIEGVGDNEFNFVGIVCYRDSQDGVLGLILKPNDDYFFTHELTDSSIYEDDLFWDAYIEAVKVHRAIPKYDECYGYVPLLGLGGSESVENMRIVKIKEYIMLIKEMLGPVQPET